MSKTMMEPLNGAEWQRDWEAKQERLAASPLASRLHDLGEMIEGTGRWLWSVRNPNLEESEKARARAQIEALPPDEFGHLLASVLHQFARTAEDILMIARANNFDVGYGVEHLREKLEEDREREAAIANAEATIVKLDTLESELASAPVEV